MQLHKAWFLNKVPRQRDRMDRVTGFEPWCWQVRYSFWSTCRNVFVHSTLPEHFKRAIGPVYLVYVLGEVKDPKSVVDSRISFSTLPFALIVEDVEETYHCVRRAAESTRLILEVLAVDRVEATTEEGHVVASFSTVHLHPLNSHVATSKMYIVVALCSYLIKQCVCHRCHAGLLSL